MTSERLFLFAHVAGHSVAIEADQVEAVVDIGAIVEVPRADRQVRGLAALRSRVMTVIDTVAALGIAEGGAEVKRAVITVVDGHHYAMLVDALEDVAAFELQPMAAGLPLEEAWLRVGRGLIERHGEPILVIDLSALVPGQPTLAS